MSVNFMKKDLSIRAKTYLFFIAYFILLFSSGGNAYAQVWQAVGPDDRMGQQGFSDTTVENIHLETSPAGIPYAAYIDMGDTSRITVKKYVSGSWSTVGARGFSKRNIRAYDMAFDKNGTPYVAFQPYEDSVRTTVMKFDGSSWVLVGNAGFTPAAPYLGTIGEVAIAIDTSGAPYVLYGDQSTAGSGKANVKKYNGSTWTAVGSSNFSYGSIGFARIAIGKDNIPYVAFTDPGAGSYWINGYYYYDGMVDLQKFNGTSWTDLGLISSGHPSSISLKVGKSGYPYIAYTDNYTGYYSSQAIQCKYYTTTWNYMPGLMFYSPGTEIDMDLDSSDHPYISFINNAGGSLATRKATVMMNDGANWKIVGDELSAIPTHEVSIAVDKAANAVYLMHINSSTVHSPSMDSAYAKKFGCKPVIASQPLAANICTGGNTSFTFAVDSGLYYQWQVNTGSSWANITNNSTYSGAGTKTLAITGATAGMNNYQYRCRAAHYCDTITSNAATLNISSGVTPSVSIAANPGSTICTGTSVTFTATPTNGGSSPSYQWKVNGGNVGTNSNTYSSTGLGNGNIVTCVMTSNASCTTTPTATSSGITMTVNSSVTPSVSIAANPGNTICTGTSVTFTATPTNGGSTPAYQWKVNGGNVGTNSTTYSNSTLANSDIVTCELTSNATCATSSTVSSSGIAMAVSNSVTPSVSISANPGSSICSGASVTFTATPTNGGSSPSYQWKVNGGNVGTNSSTYSSSALANGNVVTCVLTSNASCATTPTATSPGTTMTVNSSVTPSVSIAANPGNTICAGTSTTFTATPTNGGSTPSYQWKLNSGNVGTNSATYSNSGLSNSDVIACVLTSNATCATTPTATSSNITMTVNANVTPSVSISANPGNTVCAGTTVTFTASPTNGGSAPSYQWKVNGNNAGTNSNTYSSTGLTNGDVVTCVLTSNASCVTSSTATSSGITMTVNTNLTPAVSISANPGNTICAGTSVTFTATPVNGGSGPSYQWKVNGNNVGTNSNTYSNSGFSNSDIVTCVLASNATCVTSNTATSSGITMTVNANITPAVSIAASPGNTICAGTATTFTATLTNGGSSPAYQWKLNGSNVGTNSNTYSNSGLANGDVVTCVLTSNAVCVTTSTATSSGITMTVNSNVTPSVSISASPGNIICAGTSVTFTAAPTNGGSSPSYQWKVNGSNVGTNSSTYTSSALSNSDAVTCVLTSSATCVTSSTATSGSITMTVNANVTPSVSIAASPGNTICAGTTVTFTATPTNGGSSPSYQWKVNGSNAGTNSNTYTSAALSNSDVITCVLTSNATCVTFATATSNSISMTVNANVTPSVSVAASTGNTICAGTSVTFTASATNGGSIPLYQWKLNGANVGTGSTSYTNAGLSTGDIVLCVLTSNATCATTSTAISNNITMTVNNAVVPSMTISASPGNTICAGTPVTFTATPVNGGSTPAYQWKLNGTNVGTNSSSYTNAAPGNGNVISCVLTSNATCASAANVMSDTITMTVNPMLIPAVTISATPGININLGELVTFTANVVNGGPTPTYQWRNNNIDVPGAQNNTYATNTLANGDQVTVLVHSNATCLQVDSANSNNLVITVANKIDDIAAALTNIQLYPNPATNSFVLSGTAKFEVKGVLKMSIVNMLGQVAYVDEIPVSKQGFSKEFKLDDTIISGTYYIKIRSGDFSKTMKLTVSK